MKIEIVVIPAVDELVIKIGTEDRPANWDDLDFYQEAVDLWLLDHRNNNSESGYTWVYLATHKSTLMFDGGMTPIEGEEIAKEDILSRLESIKENCGKNVPLVALRVGDEDLPASSEDINGLMDEIKVPFIVLVGHHAMMFYSEEKD